jgi:uncharacterized protein
MLTRKRRAPQSQHIHSKPELAATAGYSDQNPKFIVLGAFANQAALLNIMQIGIMLYCIMMFINRQRELEQLDRMLRSREGSLAVVYGRRRIGKTRLLLEWTDRHGGLYTVADQSAADVQRRYFAGALAEVLPGFADVEYRDWSGLFERLGRDARGAEWKGPLVIDELPYLASAAPELASVLQRFVDHDAKSAGLKLAVAGSSQRMMQGLVLAATAPLYGRAQALFEVKALGAWDLPKAFGRRSPSEIVSLYAAWGGIPRYWELAADLGQNLETQIDTLVLDPLGPLHSEPNRLLLEELPPALELRPILEVVGQGAHRVSEIAGRIGWKATSLSRPLQRLTELGLLRREVPYGESEKTTKRSLYRLDDPFVRLWFAVVAPHRARLATNDRRARLSLLRSHWPRLIAFTWEELCRALVTRLDRRTTLGRAGAWQPAQRWWHGNAPEWDLVSESADGKQVLLGETKWSFHPFAREELARLAHQTARKAAPPPVGRSEPDDVLRALFVPELAERTPRRIDGVHIVPASDMLPG